jgi:hypothetical protein
MNHTQLRGPCMAATRTRNWTQGTRLITKFKRVNEVQIKRLDYILSSAVREFSLSHTVCEVSRAEYDTFKIFCLHSCHLNRSTRLCRTELLPLTQDVARCCSHEVSVFVIEKMRSFSRALRLPTSDLNFFRAKFASTVWRRRHQLGCQFGISEERYDGRTNNSLCARVHWR